MNISPCPKQNGRLLLLSLFFVAAASVTVAAPGDLDATFAGTGKSRFGFGGDADGAYAIAVQTNGKMIVAGYSESFSTAYFSIVRQNADGSPDASFGSGGQVLTPVGPAGLAAATGVAIQTDGKIVVAGYCNSGTASSYDFDFAVVRYNANGSPDTSFGGGDGIVTTAIEGVDDQASAVRIQTDGKIVVAGSSYNGSNYNFALVRYNSDGSLDPSFDGDGKTTTAFGAGDAKANDIAIQADGKLVLAGFSQNVANFENFTLVRYHTNGSLDNSFDLDGKVVTAMGGNSEARAVAIQPGTPTQPAKIVAAGFNHNGSTADFALVRYNFDGTLDTSFDSDGRVITPVGEAHDFGYALAIQPASGAFGVIKIIVAGYSSNDVAIVRYLVDGSLDTTFDVDGIATTPMSVPSIKAAMALLSGGKIIVATTVSSGSVIVENEDFALLRYNSDGALDNTFGEDGVSIVDVGSLKAVGKSVGIQTDGKIVVAGHRETHAPPSTFDAFVVTRLNANGSLDGSFAGDGRVTTKISSERKSDQARALAIQTDSKIVVAGLADNDFAVVRYNTDGSLDPSLGFNGKVTTPVAGTAMDGGYAVALQTDGKIVVAGYAEVSPGDTDFAVVRYNADGALDSSFDGDGILTTTLGAVFEYATAVAIQADGKIVAAGVAGNTFGVVRYNPDGSLDPSFNFDGKVTTPVGTTSDGANALLIQANGKIVVAGSAANGTNTDFALVRYNPNGSLDTSFGNGGISLTPVGAASDVANDMAIQANGKIIVVGSSQTGQNMNSLVVVRYNPNGSLDSSYGNDGKFLVDFGSVSEIGHGIALDANGKAVVAGEAGGLCGVARLIGDPAPPNATPTPTATPGTTPTPTPPSVLGNIATRLPVGTGDNVLIGGFIVTGTQNKRVIVRALGPSLAGFGVQGALANPTLELYDSNGLLASNDNWRTDQPAEIEASGIPPTNDLESAIVATLPANGAGYTAILRGVGGSTGIGVVEMYDLDASVDSKLANISTRGLVQTGDNVLIAGTIVLGPSPRKVVVRAIGPSLPFAGVLADPTLELRDANGGLLRSNDNWRTGGQEAEIIATTIPPANDLESALVETLPGNGASYTAIVRGLNNTTGIAVVEIYALN